MATFRFYATLDDQLAILRELLPANAWKVIPIVPIVKAPALASYGELTPEAERGVAANQEVELEGAFTTHPMAFDKDRSDETYSHNARVGPRLSWFRANAPVGRSGKPELGPSMFGYLSGYYDPSGAVESPSDALKVAYTTASRAIKKQLVKTKIGGTDVWVGRDAKRRFDAGELIIDP